MQIRLAERNSTVLCSADVAVLGSGLAGLTAAVTLARRGAQVCLIEPGPTLGVEISEQWVTRVPPGPVGDRVLALCAEQNGVRGRTIDALVATLALDRLVQEEGIATFVRVRPTRPVSDGDGERLAGVEVVGKSGRQFVAAGALVDATPGREFSRRALGLPARAYTAIRRRLYLHGVTDVVEAGEVKLPARFGVLDDVARFAPAVWDGEVVITFALPVVASAGSAELVFDSLTVAAEIAAFLRRADSRFAAATLVGVSPGLEPVCADADVIAAPAGVGLVTLSEPAALDEAVRAAEATAGAMVLGGGPTAPFPRRPGQGDGECVCTHELSAVREQDLAVVELPEAVAELHAPRDVVVAGYGTAGAFAALAAAEQHMKVAVADPVGLPGGIGTAGKIHSYYHGVTGGLQDTHDERVAGLTAGLAERVAGYHPVAKADDLARAMRDGGIDILHGHVVFGVVKEGDAVRGVVTADDRGYHVIPCQVAIDCTGDGDVAAAAGAEFALGRDGDGFPQPYSYTPTLMDKGVLRHRNFDAGWCDPTDTIDYSRAHFEGRMRLWRQGPFTQERHYCTLASVLGVRESRFVRGLAHLTFDDFLDGETYPDTVCEAYAHHDNHAMDYAEESDWSRRHVVMFGLWRQLCRGEVPYGALVPAGVDGLLVACRALSVDHDLHQLVRMQRDLQKLGEIAGVAAGLAVQAGVEPGAVDAAQLREVLRPRGVLPKEPPSPVMALPAEELLACLGTDRNGLAMWRLSRMRGPDAPDWSAFFASESDMNRRFCGAVAAALGDGLPDAARDVLVEAVRSRLDEPPLGVKSPPRYVVAALALCEAGAAGAADLAGELLSEASLDPPALVLVLKALELAGDPKGVPYVREFLQRNEENDFSIPLWGNAASWETSMRFTVVLRASQTLLRLGCRDEAGRLEAYTGDESLLVRRHARRLLAEATA